MSAMARIPGAFRAALPAGWIALGVAGWLYASGKGIPAWAAVPAVAAFLIEYTFYLAAGFAAIRERLASPWLPAWMVLSAIAPYLVCSLGLHVFHWWALARLAVLAAVMSLWYVVLPRHKAADCGLLAVIAAALLGKYFDPIYPEVVPRLELAVLGHLTLIHLSAFALLVQRGITGTRYGFWPDAQEWKMGALHYLFFIPVGFPLAFALGVIHLAPPAPWWRIPATFVAILWVVALSEELYFRGVLQPVLGIWVTSLLFGAVHLPFRGFPNWRLAVVAAIAGWFYGRAFEKGGSVRASAVTHALVVTTWRTLFG